MLPKRTPRRKCRGHEREWRGFCVDANLEDEWLARLNDLQAFDLISICEGHCNRQAEPSRTPPHIKLRLKERLLRGVASHWDEHKMAVVGKVNRLFETGDTYVNLELKFKLRGGPVDLSRGSGGEDTRSPRKDLGGDGRRGPTLVSTERDSGRGSRQDGGPPMERCRWKGADQDA
jgi:hypothetical protein